MIVCKIGEERGSVTVVMIALVLVALLATIWVARLGAGAVASARAATGADLAAIAGAMAAERGEDGCAQAAVVAQNNHTHLVSCTQEGPQVRVVVSSQASLGLGLGPAQARARAGPAWLASQ